ncbi:MAG: alpha/beta fold hydrolase [Clostridia bacterium]|nr:alpha/beta fold hydrolase [Clostridia bacterium]
MYKYFEINAQGNNIRCKLYYKDLTQAEKAVVFCTGFAGHKDNRAAEGFAEKVLSKYKDVLVVVFDWPAHGDDVRKKLVLDDCDTYLGLVIREMQSRFGVRELYAYATSFGGYLVLKYISEHEDPFCKIALRCPAVDMYDTLRFIIQSDEYDKLMKGKDVRVGFDRKITVTRKLLEDLQANDVRTREYFDVADSVLILHGTADEVVPFGCGKTFAEKNVIEFIPVEGADHRFQNPTHMSLANKYVLGFFDF